VSFPRWVRCRAGVTCPRAFTVVELLVVVAIISILIAVLLPVTMKARRRAVVLASPVAYARMDLGISISHPTGRAELDVAPSSTLCWNGHPQGPLWSPSGTYIGHTIHIGQGEMHYVAIVHAASGRVIRHDLGDRFCGWVDDSRFILTRFDARGTVFMIYDAESGLLREAVSRDNLRVYDATLAVAAASSGAAYVTVSHDPDAMCVVLLRSDFSRFKTLWREPNTPRYPLPEPRMDPFGEYVAWTMRDPASGGNVIAVKPIKDPTSAAPYVVRFSASPSGYGVFLDWTDDGDLMAADSGAGGSALSIYDTRGNLKRAVPVDMGPTHVAGAASWRKYWHR